ncbi:hypothetical protein ACFXGT_39775 [Streptomyces sp. NPDC059352]|uniref:hypothetical protein n=1 Tax=Streptomyces sp. NPDC059352 TaxID=3346810 RepID=UPI0036802611
MSAVGDGAPDSLAAQALEVGEEQRRPWTSVTRTTRAVMLAELVRIAGTAVPTVARSIWPTHNRADVQPAGAVVFSMPDDVSVSGDSLLPGLVARQTATRTAVSPEMTPF